MTGIHRNPLALGSAKPIKVSGHSGNNRVKNFLVRILARSAFGEAVFGLVLFSICLYLSGLLHDRPLAMGDPIFSFDAFCSFHQRILEKGIIPQWNPFSLWGRPMTQWLLVPVSLILSPFFLLMDHTPQLFYLVNVIGTAVTFFSIYLCGRILGYGKAISLVPLGLVSLGGLTYYASFFQNVSFHSFFFLLIAIVLRMHQHGMRIGPSGFFLLFAITWGGTLGLKLEGFIYGGGFIALLFAFLAFNPSRTEYEPGLSCTTYHFRLFTAFAAILLGVMATSWQFPLLMASIGLSQRVTIGGSHLQPFPWLTLLKWVSIGLLQSVSLVMMAFNALVFGVSKFRLQGKITGPWSGKFLLCLMMAEIATYFLISNVVAPYVESITNIGFTIELPHRIAYKSWVEVLCSLVAFALGTLYLAVIAEGNITLGRVAKASIAFFAGWYVSGYSWQPWPFHSQEFFYFTHPAIACFMALGAMRLVERGRWWVLGVLTCFHLMGEVGCLVSSVVAGFPWLAIRGFVVEIPLQALIVLETVAVFSELTARWSRVEPRILQRSTEWIFGVLGAGLFILWLPGAIGPNSSSGYVRLTKTPYISSTITYRLKGRPDCPPLWEAYKKTLLVTHPPSDQQGGQMFRIPVRKIMQVGSNKDIHFLPGMAGVLNTVPSYASEVSHLNRIVVYGPEKQNERVPIAWHLEQPPLMYAFIRHGLGNKFVIGDYYHSYNNLVSLTDWTANSLASRILAEEGSGVPRAFVVRNVKVFANETDEYLWLDQNNTSGLPWSLVTTSDPSFIHPNEDSSVDAFDGKVAFIKDRPEEIILDYFGMKAGFLVLLDQSAAGWHAFVDGIEQPIYRAYLTTRFMAIGKGHHTIRFCYSTPYFTLGWIISIVSLLAACFYCICLALRYHGTNIRRV